LRSGDVVLVHTGYLHWYQTLSRPEREGIANGEVHAVGLDHSEAMARYLWNSHACGVAADNPALEVAPSDGAPDAWPFGYLHHMLIGQFGLAIGELWDLHDLAEACRSDGAYEFFLTSAPHHVPGGAGSPANAIAIK
jgi:kynurenine formamidase